ncbi:hypothetical protein [Streptomyces sp. NPDC002788]
MGSRRRRRRMVVDGTVYGWCFGHRHDQLRGYPGCSSTLTLWRPGVGARLRIVFRPGPDRVIADGYLDEGAVMRLPDWTYLNLHEPGRARALLDEALARGLFPAAGTVEADGWSFISAPSARSRRATVPVPFNRPGRPRTS